MDHLLPLSHRIAPHLCRASLTKQKRFLGFLLLNQKETNARLGMKIESDV